MAALDAQRGLDVHLQAFDHAGHDGFGGRVEAACLLLDHGRCHHQHLGHRRARRQAAGHLVTLDFPRVLRAWVGRNPGQCLGFKFGCSVGTGADEVMHQAQVLRILRREQFAFDQVGLRAHQPEVARHLRHTAGAGQQTQRYFGQAELDLAVVDGDAVVADQRHFPAAAQRRAVKATHHRLAQGLQRTEVLLHQFDFGEDGARVSDLEPHRTLEVSAGKKGRFGGGQDDALDGVLVLQHLRHQFGEVLLPLQAHGVDRRIGFVKGDGGDAGGELVLDGFHENSSIG